MSGGNVVGGILLRAMNMVEHECVGPAAVVCLRLVVTSSPSSPSSPSTVRLRLRMPVCLGSCLSLLLVPRYIAGGAMTSNILLAVRDGAL